MSIYFVSVRGKHPYSALSCLLTTLVIKENNCSDFQFASLDEEILKKVSSLEGRVTSSLSVLPPWSNEAKLKMAELLLLKVQ